MKKRGQSLAAWFVRTFPPKVRHQIVVAVVTVYGAKMGLSVSDLGDAVDANAAKGDAVLASQSNQTAIVAAIVKAMNEASAERRKTSQTSNTLVRIEQAVNRIEARMKP